MVEGLAIPCMKETETHLEKFERFGRETEQPSWLFPLRKAGMARFAEFGFPTVHQEDWRFTNVAPIAKLPFKPVFSAAPDGVNSETVSRSTFGRMPGNRLVFIDGHFMASLSSLAEQPKGGTISSLAEALSKQPALVEKHLGQYAQQENQPFTALNTAFFQDGAFIHVPAGQKAEAPIHLLFLTPQISL